MRISAPKLTFEMISKVTFTQCVPRGEKGGGEDFIAAHFSRVGFSSFSSLFCIPVWIQEIPVHAIRSISFMKTHFCFWPPPAKAVKRHKYVSPKIKRRAAIQSYFPLFAYWARLKNGAQMLQKEAEPCRTPLIKNGCCKAIIFQLWLNFLTGIWGSLIPPTVTQASGFWRQ